MSVLMGRPHPHRNVPQKPAGDYAVCSSGGSVVNLTLLSSVGWVPPFRFRLALPIVSWADMASERPFWGSRASQRYAWNAFDFQRPKRLSRSKSGTAWRMAVAPPYPEGVAAIAREVDSCRRSRSAQEVHDALPSDGLPFRAPEQGEVSL